MNTLKTTLLLLATCALFACESGPSGRIMSDTEDDNVGNRSAGAPAFDRLISNVVERQLKDHSAAHTFSPKVKVVCLPVENASSEELGDWQEHIYELIDSSINRSDRYAMISKRYVNAALREARLRPDQLFIPGNRRTFAAILESQGEPVDTMLFPKLTSGTTPSAGVTQRNYLLTLELVDLKSGYSKKFSSDALRKEYR